jgi:HAL2 family 3'(2'),5'-bisphosphate nucleotidase
MKFHNKTIKLCSLTLQHSAALLLSSSFPCYAFPSSSSLFLLPLDSNSIDRTISNSSFRGFFTKKQLKSYHKSHDTFSGVSEIPLDYPHRDIVQTALSAIRAASRITTLLQPNSINATTISNITKSDSSPVTIGDFAAQAIVLRMLSTDKRLENDIFIAEESSKNLNDELAKEIMNVLNTCKLTNIIGNEEELRKSIDLGQTYEDNGSIKPCVLEQRNSSRRWCLDPIDGTRGFLRGKREGGQYCIALALIENGVPILGILACPNLPTDASDEEYQWMEEETEENNQMSRGCIFIASKGGGTYQLPLFAVKGHDDSSLCLATRVFATVNDCTGGIPTSKARFCIGVENYSDANGLVPAIAEKIHGGLDKDGQILYTRRMDSQVKYGVLARGGAEIMTRLPSKSYVEWIWDHAAGKIVLEEAGGLQTDTNGNEIDYGLGAKMNAEVNGLLMSSGGVFHDSLVDAFTKVQTR